MEKDFRSFAEATERFKNAQIPPDSPLPAPPTRLACLVFAAGETPPRLRAEKGRSAIRANGSCHIFVEATRVGDALAESSPRVPRPCRTLGCIGCGHALLPHCLSILVQVKIPADFASIRSLICKSLLDAPNLQGVVGISIDRFKSARQNQSANTVVKIFIAKETDGPSLLPRASQELQNLSACRVLFTAIGRHTMEGLATQASPCKFCRPEWKLDHTAAEPCPFAPSNRPMSLIVRTAPAILTSEFVALLSSSLPRPFRFHFGVLQTHSQSAQAQSLATIPFRAAEEEQLLRFAGLIKSAIPNTSLHVIPNQSDPADRSRLCLACGHLDHVEQSCPDRESLPLTNTAAPSAPRPPRAAWARPAGSARDAVTAASAAEERAPPRAPIVTIQARPSSKAAPARKPTEARILAAGVDASSVPIITEEPSAAAAPPSAVLDVAHPPANAAATPSADPERRALRAQRAPHVDHAALPGRASEPNATPAANPAAAPSSEPEARGATPATQRTVANPTSPVPQTIVEVAHPSAPAPPLAPHPAQARDTITAANAGAAPCADTSFRAPTSNYARAAPAHASAGHTSPAAAEAATPGANSEGGSLHAQRAEVSSPRPPAPLSILVDPAPLPCRASAAHTTPAASAADTTPAANATATPSTETERGGFPASKRTAAIPSSPSHGRVDACARVNLVDRVMEQDGKVDAGSDAVESSPSTAPAEHHPSRLHTSPPHLGKRSREDALSPSTGQTPPTIRRFSAAHINPPANALAPPSSEPEAQREGGATSATSCVTAEPSPPAPQTLLVKDFNPGPSAPSFAPSFARASAADTTPASSAGAAPRADSEGGTFPGFPHTVAIPSSPAAPSIYSRVNSRARVSFADDDKGSSVDFIYLKRRVPKGSEVSSDSEDAVESAVQSAPPAINAAPPGAQSSAASGAEPSPPLSASATLKTSFPTHPSPDDILAINNWLERGATILAVLVGNVPGLHCYRKKKTGDPRLPQYEEVKGVVDRRSRARFKSFSNLAKAREFLNCSEEDLRIKHGYGRSHDNARPVIQTLSSSSSTGEKFIPFSSSSTGGNSTPDGTRVTKN